MRVWVWLSSWQQQCCGVDFGVGSTVRWAIHRHDSSDEWIEQLLGPQRSARIGFVEDHHLDAADGTLTGVVAGIEVVTSERTVRSTVDGWVRIAVPGSARLRPVQLADRWEPEPRGRDRRSFDGWIVELTGARYSP